MIELCNRTNTSRKNGKNNWTWKYLESRRSYIDALLHMFRVNHVSLKTRTQIESRTDQSNRNLGKNENTLYLLVLVVLYPNVDSKKQVSQQMKSERA